MTDQDNLVRDHSVEIAEDDPLAELARIVSGQPPKPAPSFASYTRSFADVARSAPPRAAPRAPEPVASPAPPPLPAAEPAVEASQSIEDALMRELGFSDEPEIEVQPAAELAREVEAHFQEHEFAAAQAVPEPSAQPALSLEDQLMAELGMIEVASQPEAALPYEPAPLHDNDAVEIEFEPSQEAAEEFDADAVAMEFERALEMEALEIVADEAGDPAGFAEPVEDVAGALPDDDWSREWAADREAEMAGAHEFEAQEDVDHDAHPDIEEDWAEFEAAAASLDSPVDEAAFAQTLEASLELNGAHETPHAAGEAFAEPAYADEEQFFEELARQDGPPRTIPVGVTVDEGRPVVARGSDPALPAAADPMADMDFGAAFEEEFRQIEAERPQPLPVARAAAVDIAPQALEEQFAAAFAEELDLDGEFDDLSPPPASAVAPHDNGWRHGETRVANQAFVAAAAHAPARQQTAARNEADDAWGDASGYADPDGDFLADPDHYGAADFEDEPAPVIPARRANRGFAMAAAALGLALVVGGGAVAYGYLSGGGDSAELPVVRADAEPVKVKPADPGGAEVANQDKAVYDRVAGATPETGNQEKLVSDVEEPVDIAALTESAEPAAAAEEPAAPEVAVGAQATDGELGASPFDTKAEERLTPGLAASAGAQPNPALAPRRVRTVAVKPDGTLVSQPQPASLPVQQTTLADTQTSANAFAASAPDTDNSGAGGLAPIDGLVTDAAPVVPQPRPQVQQVAALAPSTAPAPAPKPAAPSRQTERAVGDPVQIAPQQAAASSAPPPPTAGGWAVQLASQRSAEDAQATFQNLRSRFPSVLGGRALAVQRAEVEGKGVFFRVRVPAATREEANVLCEQLKAAGGSCFVTR